MATFSRQPQPTIEVPLTPQQADYVAWALWKFLGSEELMTDTRELIEAAGSAIEVANKRDGEWSTAFFQKVEK